MEAYEKLERDFGNWLGCDNTVAVASGTAALHIALESLKLPPGSEVLVPEFTMIACARAVTLAGLRPVFVDVTEDLLMDPDKVSRSIGPSTKAIMPVAIYGRACSTKLWSLARNRELVVIEDLAEAHGIAPHPETVAACWSFYRNKIVAGEEGGMISFCCNAYAARARQLRSLGFTEDHNFLHTPRGISARMSNAHARLVLTSLANAYQNITLRRAVEKEYNKRIPVSWKMPDRDAVWVYDVRLPTDIDIGQVVSMLNQQGIAARVGFRPMSEQPEYRATSYRELNAYRLSCRIIYLPVYPAMATEEVVRIVTALKRAVALPCAQLM